MTILGAIIGLSAFLSAIAYPPLALAIYMVFSIDEAFGTGIVVTGGYFSYLVMFSAALASAISLYQLMQRANLNRKNRRLFVAGSIAMATIFWIGASVFISGDTIRSVMEKMAGCGISSIIIVFAYYDRVWLYRWLVLAVLANVFLSFVSFAYPGSRLDFSGGGEGLAPQQSVLSLEEIKEGNFGKQSAQFINPVNTNFYGIVAVLLGLWMVKTFRPLLFFLGLLAVGMGVFVAMNSLMRALLLGMMGSLIITIVWRCVKSSSLLVVFLLCGVIGSFFASSFVVGLADSLSGTSLGKHYLSYEDGLDYRLKAISNSPLLIAESPIFGFGSTKYINQRIDQVPHQHFLSSTLIYGLPVGLSMLYFTWISLAPSFQFFRAQNTADTKKNLMTLVFIPSFSVCLGWMTLALNLSNGSSPSPSGALGWICTGVAALPWLLRERKTKPDLIKPELDAGDA